MHLIALSAERPHTRALSSLHLSPPLPRPGTPPMLAIPLSPTSSPTSAITITLTPPSPTLEAPIPASPINRPPPPPPPNTPTEPEGPGRGRKRQRSPSPPPSPTLGLGRLRLTSPDPLPKRPCRRGHRNPRPRPPPINLNRNRIGSRPQRRDIRRTRRGLPPVPPYDPRLSSSRADFDYSLPNTLGKDLGDEDKPEPRAKESEEGWLGDDEKEL